MAQPREIAMGRIALGAVMAAVGIGVTIATYTAAAGGGSYVITYGLIISGIGTIISGVMAFRAAPPLEPVAEEPSAPGDEPPIPAGTGPLRVWNEFWYGFEVPARTLRVFRIGFFAVLSIDAWMQIEHAPRYGAGDFNVAHADWIAGLFPMPSAAGMAVVFVLQAYLAARVAFGARPRWSAGVLAALFGYGYFISQLNSYQHHYLMFLALIVCSMVPWERAIKSRNVRTWAVRLLLVQISLVYVWAVVAKLDNHWLDGTTLSKQVRSLWWRDLITDYGSWAFAAQAVIAVELFLAFAIHVRILRPAAFVLGIALHVSIEAIGFKIGLFSYFMVALYPLVAGARLPWWAFGPGLVSLMTMVGAEDGVSLADFDDPGVRTMWVAVAAYVAMMPAGVGTWQRSLAGHIGRIDDKLVTILPNARWFGMGALALAGIAGVALLAPLPFDYMVAAGLVALVLAAVPVAFTLRARWRDAVVHLVACATVLVLHAETDQARDHYKFLGGDLRRRGDLIGATLAYERVVMLDPGYVSGHVRLGDLYRRRDRFDSAAREYRTAVGLDPDTHRAYIGEAMIHIRMQRMPEASTALSNAEAALRRTLAKTADPRKKRALGNDAQRIQRLRASVRR